MDTCKVVFAQTHWVDMLMSLMLTVDPLSFMKEWFEAAIKDDVTSKSVFFLVILKSSCAILRCPGSAGQLLVLVASLVSS